MSRNCVDAALELARTRSLPLMLIASRRQIECESLGGGYVESWTTETFSRYVHSQPPGPFLLARDHGGPWQGRCEYANRLSIEEAMERAKISYRADIESGFQMIHIDASLDPRGAPDRERLLDRVFELYEYCYATARRLGREILFEVGTDEQVSEVQDASELETLLESMRAFCARSSLPAPTFVVAQTGTKVLETENVGSFDGSGSIALERLLACCEVHSVLLKEHNADYLPASALRRHPGLGIHAANVAPEFGVAETRAFLRLLRCHSLGSLADQFLELSYDAGHWRKWLKPDSTLSPSQRAILGGHYVFATAPFREIKARAVSALSRWGVDVDTVLRASLHHVLCRYIGAFGLTRARPCARLPRPERAGARWVAGV